jgi:diaminopropionate ammonia-lyase
MSPVRALQNPLAATEQDLDPAGRAPLDFHRRLPEYAATTLVDAPGLAGALGVGKAWVKDESWRLWLPAFKILGASWAVYRALEQRSDGIGEWGDLEELRGRLAPLLPLTLAAATDGNHGRAVARMAGLLGLGARIFVPADMAPARIEAIRSEGAEVVVVRDTYDDAVARSAEEADGRCLVISDTSWPSYEDVPRWVIDGYSTILWEVEDELGRLGEGGPTLVVVQIGVGAFAAAVTRHFRSSGVFPRPKILGVEPVRAACALASAEAGSIIHLPGPHDSIMAGLNCGSPSIVAWPVLSKGVDLFVEIEDRWAREAMRMMAGAGIVSGETGAAGLAGLLALAREGDRGELGLTEEERVLVFNCEGAIDPGAYGRIVAGADGPPPSAPS